MQLSSITAEIHVWDGVPNLLQPVRLGIAIGEHVFLRVGERRGESICIDETPLDEADLGDGCRIEVHDVTEVVGFKPGDRVEQPRYIRDRWDGIVGVVLAREGGSRLCLWCEDDEFQWGPEDRMRAALQPCGVRIAETVPLRSPTG